jgi:anti-sigma B factor antagonist
MVPNPHFRVEEADDVRVVRLLDRALYDDRIVREVADALLNLVARLPSPPRLVLDLGAVDSVSSSMLGKLILLQRRVDAAGGQLRLCDVRPSILGVMQTTNLNRLFRIDHDRREALEAIAQAHES